MSHSATEGKQTREEKREAKRQKKAAQGPGVLGNLKQAHEVAKQSQPNITLIMVLVGLLVVFVFLGLGVLLHNWITWTIIGIPFGVLAAVILLTRVAERAAFAQIDGRTGASGAALSTLRRGWVVEEQPVQVNPRTQDVVFRAIGRPGIVLVTEGPKGRVGKLVNSERNHVRRVAPNVPVHVINSGNGEGQVPLKQLTKTINKLPKSLTPQEVHAVNNRLASLGNSMPIPKGVDPRRARPDRKSMRGR